MCENRLKIVSVERSQSKEKAVSQPKRRRDEAKAKFERMWLVDPEQFNPNRNCRERERITRTWNALLDYIEPSEDIHVADLGCGEGIFSQRLCEKHALVHAVDIASQALKHLEKTNYLGLKTSQDYVPRTLLPDDSYDLVLSTELIGYLPPDEFRLYFSELARLVKPKGFVICSTAIDINSDDALQRFAAMAETEFKIEKWIFSYHLLHIRVHNILTAPTLFVKASKDVEYRHSELSQRTGFGKWWFKINSTSPISFFWSGIQFLIKPLTYLIEQNRTVLTIMEKISRFIWSDSGINHVIFIGTRRPLVEAPAPQPLPVERKQKRQVWE